MNLEPLNGYLRGIFPRVPLAVPFWSGETYRAIAGCVLSGRVVDGPETARLRSQILTALGVEQALLCGSGSLALEIALRICEVQPGDEVVLPAFCCSAVVPPVMAVGAVPVLADVGEELNLTVETVAAALTGKTKAIIVPHLFGNPADIGPIVELAAQRNIRVIDDAAQALGATIDGRAVGSFGDAGIISFGNEKICFGIGGGAVVSNQRERLDERSLNLPPARMKAVLRRLVSTQFNWRWRRWTLHLQSKLWRGQSTGPDALPVPYRSEAMANLPAALAVSLLQTWRQNLAARRKRIDAYQELLGGEDRLELIAHRAGSACLTQVVRILPRRHDRDLASALVDALGASGYEVQGSYVPIHLLGSFDRCVWDRLPYADSVWASLVELPCEPSVSNDDVEQISSALKKLARSDIALRQSAGKRSSKTPSHFHCSH